MVEENQKIAQVVSTFPPYRGGMGNVAYHLADQLSRRTFEVEVFTPRYSLREHSFNSHFKIHKLNPQFKYGNAAIVLQLAGYLLKFDVIHLHYPFLGASTAVLLAKLIKRKKLKFILHYHMDLVGRDWKSWVYKSYNWFFLKNLVRAADQIIVSSQDYLKNSLLNRFYGRYENKFRILPNGVDTDYFHPQNKDNYLVSKYRLNGKKVILFVGALDSAHYFKGVNYLIKAVEFLNRDDYRLIIVGDGDLKPVYENMVESSALSERVVFTGYVPDEELIKYYNLADIFILPSIDQSEAFGMVLLEAMACAKPVIATDLAGVREVVEKKINGLLVKPKNPELLAKLINELLNNPALCQEYGQNGRAKVEKFYGWDIVTENLLKIYFPKK
ncbi:MAG: hypothetical protein A2927_00160 [Candidatus Komeilibacteria bacterium RIFCSPLOWO2_01_FULL_45_10]|uniref:Glycosyltransferase subfamily 4-like N-terminal domain-containing protein n=1 Tax=Candidatus Komeilibacteria bacterium RIFCSPLOWO2_01_FULL_45_10 TaxID=1798550 RepID=A0A1G2BKU5_9BACT|nr:MAG: hypothetical protein A2927_00160 [Candidatus Komeilibacteria bacterium RIFCSPLOWO2_01_FULL_45_10]